MVDRYWIDPELILAEHLEEESDRVLLDIFADVP